MTRLVLLLAPLALLALLALLPAVTAEPPPGISSCGGMSVSVPNDDNDDDDALQLTVHGPCQPVPIGTAFSVVLVLASEESTYLIQPLEIIHIHGCAVLESQNSTNMGGHSATAWYELQMDEDTCDFVVLATSLSPGVIEPDDVVYAYGAFNVAAYTLQDIGQAPGRALADGVLPVLIAIGLLVFALFRTLNHHPAWNGLFLVAFLGLTTEALGFMDLTTEFMLFVAGAWMAIILIGKRLGFQRKDGENENG